ncbi:MAG TPA: hypothetical protein VGC80_16470, partial [Acetobacteraceae bacterium]
MASALLTVGSASAWANTNWTVSGLFDDNASVGGTITWDSNAPLSWHLETTVGSSLVFPAVYDSAPCAPGSSACGSNATLFNPGEWSFDNPD